MVAGSCHTSQWWVTEYLSTNTKSTVLLHLINVSSTSIDLMENGRERTNYRPNPQVASLGKVVTNRRGTILLYLMNTIYSEVGKIMYVLSPCAGEEGKGLWYSIIIYTTRGSHANSIIRDTKIAPSEQRKKNLKNGERA